MPRRKKQRDSDEEGLSGIVDFPFASIPRSSVRRPLYLSGIVHSHSDEMSLLTAVWNQKKGSEMFLSEHKDLLSIGRTIPESLQGHLRMSGIKWWL